MKGDPDISRKTQRSAASSPYTRRSPCKPRNDVVIMPSLGTLFPILKRIASTFIPNTKVEDDPPLTPPLSTRNSEAEISTILPTQMDSDPDEEDDGVYLPCSWTTMTPAKRLAMRGQQLEHQSLNAPVSNHSILPALKDGQRLPSRYAPKPDHVSPAFAGVSSTNRSALSYPTVRSPVLLKDIQTGISPQQNSMQRDNMSDVVNFINQKLANNQPLSVIEAYGLRALIDESVEYEVKPLAANPSRSFGLSSSLKPTRPSHVDTARSLDDSKPVAQAQLQSTLSISDRVSRIPVTRKNPNPPLVYRGPGRSAHTTPRGTHPTATGINGLPRIKSVRYRSNMFGMSGAEAAHVPAMTATNQQQTDADTKRRRLDEDSDVSSSKIHSPAKNVHIKLNSYKLSTPRHQRPLFGVGPATTSVPRRPSPLRQSMRPDSPSSSQGSSQQVDSDDSQLPPSRRSWFRGAMSTVHESPVHSRSFHVLAQVIANNPPNQSSPSVLQNPYQALSPFRTRRPAVTRNVVVPARLAADKALTALELIGKTSPALMDETARPKSPSPPRLKPTPSSAPPLPPLFGHSSLVPSTDVRENLAKVARAAVFKPAEEVTAVKTSCSESFPECIEAKKPKPVVEIIDLVDDDEEEEAAKHDSCNAAEAEAEEEEELDDDEQQDEHDGEDGEQDEEGGEDDEDEDEEDEEEESDDDDDVVEVFPNASSNSALATASDTRIASVQKEAENEANDGDEVEAVVIVASSASTFTTSGDRADGRTLLSDLYRARGRMPFQQMFQSKPDGPLDTPSTGSPRVRAMELEETRLPTFTFVLPKAVTPGRGIDRTAIEAARYKAANVPVTALPKFNFGASLTNHWVPAAPAFSIPASVSATRSSWAAVDIKPQKLGVNAWNCGVRTIFNDAAQVQSVACEVLRPISANKSSVLEKPPSDRVTNLLSSNGMQPSCPVCMTPIDASLRPCAACGAASTTTSPPTFF